MPARTAPEAVARVVRRFAEERSAAETFPVWLDRVGGAAAVAEGLAELDTIPTPDEDGPFTVSVSESECAT